MNICFFSGDITRSGGTERVAILIANRLSKQSRYHISFLSLTERKKEPFFEIDAEIERDRLYDEDKEGIVHLPGHISRLKKIVKAKDIDILVDIDGIIDMYTVPVKWFTGVKVISWEHFNLYFHPSKRLRDMVRKFAVNRVDAVVTLTTQDKEYYEKAFSKHARITAIPNPVTDIEDKGEYNPDTKTILSVGRLTYQKGFDRLVDVADIVLKKHPDWQWIILGEGEDRETLESLVSDKNLSDKLVLAGNVDNIDDWYEKTSIFVMTSRYEGLPMTLLEAMYHRLPMVSYDIKTGPRECIIDGVNGFLITDEDSKSMAEKILSLMEDRNMRLAFSKHCLDEADKFSMEKIEKQWEELLDELGDKI